MAYLPHSIQSKSKGIEIILPVDTHVSRVSKRLGLAKKNDDVLTIEKKLNRKIPKELLGRTHHQFILFGRYYCKAISPLCDKCELKDICKKKDVMIDDY